MALLSQMFRTAAITGRTDTVNAWFADRQGGRWAEQKVQAAFPNLPPYDQKPPADRTEALRQLTDLHERGIITDAEFERLRG